MPATSQRLNDPGLGLSSHPELASEQAYIDYAYERLEVMRAEAARRRDAALELGAEEIKPLDPTGEDGLGGVLFEREAFHSAGLLRLRQLELGEHSLVFGRIDLDADGDAGETFYIGRLAVSGPGREPIVVDWRVPVAEPFYRATGMHPLGLRRRRHFVTEGRTVAGIEDELFGQDGGGDRPTRALLVALERSRSGRMRDIVSTIQREQDEIIRAPLEGVLVVQGGPGTGKTAVALHRAAYLLFTHRRWLDRRGLLVVGPNQLYLQYIDQVLPALGESGVALSTFAGLVPDVSVRGVDTPETATVKGDGRMARVLERAVQTRERPLRMDAVLDFDGQRLVLHADATRRMVKSARGGAHATHNDRRRNLERLVLRELYRQYRRARQPNGTVRPRAGDPAPEEFNRLLRRDPEMRLALDRMWPRLSPQELVHDLLGSRALLADAGKGVLRRREIDALYRPWSESMRAVPWTAADIPLIDEARVLLGPRRRRPGDEDAGEAATYGHVVVDEVQDLTAMQLRMLARRAPLGSMTLVGDVAQATSHASLDGWDQLLAHLRTHSGVRRAKLSVNYRTPSEIMDYAARVQRAAVPHVEAPESVRSTGEHPAVVRAARELLCSEVAKVAAAEASEVGDGTVAVVCASSMVTELDVALTESAVRFGEAERDGLAESVTLVAVEVVKGLEFDSVVVVEPARIAQESAGGLRALYVALTRPTRRLTVVHSEPLPGELVEDAPGAGIGSTA